MLENAAYQNVLRALQDLPPSRFIAEGAWWFPGLEATHVITAALVVGSIAMLDLRLLYAASRERAVSALSAEVLPYVWGAFAAAVVTGGLLFMSAATHYGANWPFLAKMALLLLAGVNMAVFHRLTAKSAHEWDIGRSPAWEAKAAGALSMIFWIGVIICGRWIGFS